MKNVWKSEWLFSRQGNNPRTKQVTLCNFSKFLFDFTENFTDERTYCRTIPKSMNN